MKTLGLALSGGAAKGLVHIAVFELFESLKLPIDYIAGVSAGALFGGMYAAGMTPNEILRVLDSEEFKKLIKYKYLSLNWNFFNPFKWQPGIFKLDRVYNFLNKVLNNVNIENTAIPFIACYTDGQTNKTVTVKKGNLAEAIIYSISFPFVFSSYKNKHAFDGGLKCNCPVINLIEAFKPNYVLAVDVTSIKKYDGMYNKDILSFANRMFDLVWCDTFVEDLNQANWIIDPPMDDFKFFDFGSSKMNTVRSRVMEFKNNGMIDKIEATLKEE